jgi:hypothetical protein
MIQLSTKALLDYVKKHPDCTSKQIAADFNLKIERTSGALLGLYKQGRVTREVSHKSVSGATVYKYRFKTAASPMERNVSAKEPIKQTTHKQARVPVKEHIEVHATAQPSVSLESMLDGIAAQLAASLIVRVKAALSTELQHFAPALPSPEEVKSRLISAPKAVSSKVCVGVTGLLPQQAGVIQPEFHDCFDLSFWNDKNGDSTEQLKAMARRCVKVLIHTNHSSHSTQEIVKSAGGSYLLVPGGLTAMKDALTKLYVEETCDV